MGKVTRRPQAAKSPREERNRSIIVPSSVTASPCHLPPEGKAFLGGEPPHPPQGEKEKEDGGEINITK